MAKRVRKGTSVQGKDLFSSSKTFPAVGCTDPAKEPARLAKLAKDEAKTAADKIKAEEIKDNRIEQIAALMRVMSNPEGEPTWNRKVAKSFAKLWRMEHRQVLCLATEASKRVIADIEDDEGVKRKTGIAWEAGLYRTLASGKFSDLAKFVQLGVLIQNNAQRVEVEVEVKEPTPADAKAAVKKNFPKDFKKEDQDGQEGKS